MVLSTAAIGIDGSRRRRRDGCGVMRPCRSRGRDEAKAPAARRNDRGGGVPMDAAASVEKKRSNGIVWRGISFEYSNYVLHNLLDYTMELSGFLFLQRGYNLQIYLT